jgi:hypothetical protein
VASTFFNFFWASGPSQPVRSTPRILNEITRPRVFSVGLGKFMAQQWRLASVLICTFLICARAEPLVTANDAVRAGLAADTTAKYLAGMVVPSAPLDAKESESPWAVHSRELDRAWRRTEQQQLPAIASWAADFLSPAYQDARTVFYMFSGPDFLYAHAFFGNARTYILCGTEPVGALPELDTIPPEQLSATLANLRKSLESVLSWSFFITKDMTIDLAQTHLSGTLPLLYVFLARTGCTIDSVTPVTIDRNGNMIENGKGESPGVRILISGSSGLSQTVYYFCTDLSDDGIKSKPGFLRFCERQGRGVSLVKAASYLMHEPGFSRVRDFLLIQSDVIVQDDSGIPLRFFAGRDWNVRYCGRYVGPINVFKQYWQSDLAEAYARSAPPPLPFSFGYQWQRNRSDVVIAARANSVAMAKASTNQEERPLIEEQLVNEPWEENAARRTRSTFNEQADSEAETPAALESQTRPDR